MAGIELRWNVILSQWTGLYKLGRNGFQPTQLLCDGAKKFSIPPALPSNHILPL